MLSANAGAVITGICSNCHTMHNSQDGNPVANSGGAAWNGGKIQGGTLTTANDHLLVSDCVGCHSNTGSETVLTVGSSKIPIVYNTNGYPTTPLAGGNFALVPSDDTKGHNVYGIAGQDSNLSYAPGAFDDTGGNTIGCSNSCHQSLALSPSQNTGRVSTGEPDGCQGCHGYVAHHANNDASTQPRPTAANGGYRFLGPPAGHPLGGTVDGVEDPDWEYTKSATDHNVYAAEVANDYENPQSMGKFCAGCHGTFHANGDPNSFTTVNVTGIFNGDGSSANPWIRHPANFPIPNAGEFAQVIGQAYDPTIPVAKNVQASYNAGIVNAGDQVICLSCHRAHGSDQSDMLRFSYSQVVAHSSTTGNATNGCFFCHRNKDNAN
jgi:predicted CXXCH cytochrome family protein